MDRCGKIVRLIGKDLTQIGKDYLFLKEKDQKQRQ